MELVELSEDDLLKSLIIRKTQLGVKHVRRLYHASLKHLCESICHNENKDPLRTPITNEHLEDHF